MASLSAPLFPSPPSPTDGKSLTWSGEKGTIVGVVKDFNYKSAQSAIEPMMLMFNKWNGGTVIVRTQPGKTEATIQALEKINKQLNPSFPFSYGFVDQDINNLYKGEQQMGSLFNVFAIIAIFISVYGGATHQGNRRKKSPGSVSIQRGVFVIDRVYKTCINCHCNCDTPCMVYHQ